MKKTREIQIKLKEEEKNKLKEMRKSNFHSKIIMWIDKYTESYTTTIHLLFFLPSSNREEIGICYFSILLIRFPVLNEFFRHAKAQNQTHGQRKQFFFGVETCIFFFFFLSSCTYNMPCH